MTGPALPPLPPLVVAQVVEGLPARLAARLDAAVAAARSWPRIGEAGAIVVRVDGTTSVRVPDTVTVADDITCSCLLAPRCLHRAAVASLAPPAAPAGASGVDAAPDAVTAATVPRAVTAPEVAAAEVVWRCAGRLLTRGVAGFGAADQAALLRAAHEARVLRLPRAATAAVRVVERVRANHADDAGFDLAALVDDLRELMATAHGLRRGRPLHGISRRDYTLAGDARLYGLFCEPVVTASGYAGAVTHLVDATGRRFTVARVRPGGAADAVRAAGSPVEVGDARPTHHELARGGLIAAGLRATADGRLSSGRDTRAVRASGAGWTQRPLAGLWDPPYAQQRAACAEARSRPPEEREPDSDLLFLAGVVTGAARDAVTFTTADGTDLLLVAPHDTPELRYVDNLRVLGRAAGAPIRAIARPVAPRRVALLAMTADWLPGAYGGHVDLGVDTLGGEALRVLSSDPAWRSPDVDGVGQAGAAATPPVHPLPPIHLLERRVRRAIVNGRLATAGDPADVAVLERSAMPQATAYARDLDGSAYVHRDPFGRATPGSTDRYALAWLAAAIYVAAVSAAIDAEP
jgi:hypothetical protein